MSLKTRIKNLANEQGIGLTALEAKLGFGNGTITKWDKTTPNADKLSKVAKFFGVSMDYLLNGVDQNGLSEKDNRDIAKDLNSLKRKTKCSLLCRISHVCVHMWAEAYVGRV